ncbi:MAG: hypothetical protein C4554_01155 [Dethiobacter sp.]|jgi:hypothetical protein|nr:MAG: hypothetical protein C4554_01155 [Dethiobacter sp.]
MDLVITLIAVLLFFLWPHLGQVRFIILLFLGLGVLFIALIFAPILLLSPLFYLGLAILIVLIFYKGLSKGKKEQG